MLISIRTIATMAEKRGSYSFASGTSTAAVSGTAAGKASRATGIGSGSATARENNIMAIATMTLKGIMTALVEETRFVEGRAWSVGESYNGNRSLRSFRAQFSSDERKVPSMYSA